MKFLDFEAHIVVDGERLPEYSVEYEEKTKTAVCWVPSEAGKFFSVTGILPRSDIDVVAQIFTDGIYAKGSILQKGRSPWAHMKCSGIRTSATTSRPLMFASIELTDDDTLLNSANHKDLGEITVELYQVEILSETAPFKSSATLINNPIHERSKKAMAHRINLGPEIMDPARTFMTYKHLEMLCKLTLKYRSIDILRADGIAPPASAPPETDSKRKTLEDDDVDDDEEQDSDEADQEEQDKAQLKALLEQITILEAKMAKKSTKARLKKKVKTEHRSVFIPGEVIDLTL